MAASQDLGYDSGLSGAMTNGSRREGIIMPVAITLDHAAEAGSRLLYRKNGDEREWRWMIIDAMGSECATCASQICV